MLLSKSFEMKTKENVDFFDGKVAKKQIQSGPYKFL